MFLIMLSAINSAEQLMLPHILLTQSCDLFNTADINVANSGMIRLIPYRDLRQRQR